MDVPAQWMVAWAFKGVPISRAKARAAIRFSACRPQMRFVVRCDSRPRDYERLGYRGVTSISSLFTNSSQVRCVKPL